MATSCEGGKAAIEREKPGVNRYYPLLTAHVGERTDEVPGETKLIANWPGIRLLPLATSSNFSEQ
jgi:hypothetical protein